MKIHRRITVFSLAFLFLFSASHVFALTISPAKMELSGAPGQVISGEIELFNEQAESKVFYSSYENFEPSGESGSPHFIGGKTGLATWIVTDESVSLNGGDRKKIPFTITIPKDAVPGGYFSGVFFGGQSPNNQKNGEVAIGGKLGTLVLLRVEGDIEEKAGLVSFFAEGGRRFFSNLPISFSYKLNNQGADRIVPIGDIVVTNTFGLKSVTLPANKNEGSILPSSARSYAIVWSADSALPEDAGFFATVGYQFKNFHIGWYTAHLDVKWGMQNNSSSARYDFLFFPWQASLVIVALLILALFVLTRYNKWIVKRSQNGRNS